MSALREILASAIDRALADGPALIGDVVDDAYTRRPEVFAAESERMVLESARGIVKKMLSAMSEDDDQPGQLTLTGLPSAIAVRDDDNEIRYVRSDLATWRDIEAGYRERDLNVSRAIARRERYRGAMDSLRPLMAHDETLTAGEAIRRANRRAA